MILITAFSVKIKFMKRSLKKGNQSIIGGPNLSQKKKRNLKFYKEEFRNLGSRNGNYIEYMYFAPRF